jgi:hypothetical protein
MIQRKERFVEVYTDEATKHSDAYVSEEEILEALWLALELVKEPGSKVSKRDRLMLELKALARKRDAD